MAIYINGSTVAYGTSQTGGVEQVAALPSTGDIDHLYYLTVADATHEVGLYYWTGAAWVSTGSGSGSGTDNYEELSNKPKINGVELVGNKALAVLDIAQQSTTYTKTQVDSLISAAQKVYVTTAIPTAANNVGLYYVDDGTGSYNIYLVDSAKRVTNLGSASISLDGYQKQEDFNLETTDQTVVGGINELKYRLDNLPSGGTITMNEVITGSPTFYAPVNSGTFGQVLLSHGFGSAPEWTDFSASGTALKLNGSTTAATEASVWVPIEGGIAGQILTSQGTNLAPVWKDAAGSTGGTNVTLNDVSYAGKSVSLYAPTINSTTAGQCVISQASGIPTWGNKSYVTVASTGSSTNEAKYLTVDGTEYKLAGGGMGDVILNGEAVTGTLEFYAPTRAGAQNAIIVSNGPGIAPSWKTSLRTVSLTKAQYDALSDVEKSDTSVMYAVTDEGGETIAFDAMYPLNSVYWSTTATVPANFKGTWTKLGTSTSIISGYSLTAFQRTV